MSLIIDPVDNFLNGKDFFIRENGVFHNGINIETKGPVKTITTGKILAYRFSEDFIPLETIKTNQFLQKHFHYVGNGYFDNSKNDKNNYYETYFEKIDSCSTEGTAEAVYKLKENLSNYDKIEAYYYLGRVISNSFVLMEYEVTLLNAETFKFYMLYNHLAPMGRLTCSQKTELIWYNSKLSCKSAKYYYVETTDGTKLPSELPLKSVQKIGNTDEYNISWDGYPGLSAGSGTIKGKFIRPDIKETRRPFRPGIDSEAKKNTCLKDEDLKQQDGVIVYTTDSLSSRNVSAILDKNTDFDYILKELREINKTFYPYKISYNGINGYIYLNETQEYKTKEEWTADIDKYSNVITNTNVDIKLKTCELKIRPKELKNKNGTTFTIEENKIGLPTNLEIDGGEVIGYSGFNFMREEKVGNFNYVSYDNDLKPFNIHIETFVESEDKLKFDYYKNSILKSNKELEPCFYKVKAGTEIVSKEPSCKTQPSTESFEGCIAKVEKNCGHYSNEEFYKLTIYVKTKTVDKNVFIENGKITQWTDGNWYMATTSDATETYNEKAEQITDKSISLLPGYIYYVNDGRDPDTSKGWGKAGGYASKHLRHIECLYEALPQPSVYYIKSDEYSKLKQLKKDYKIKNDLTDLVWIQSKLDSTNICKQLSEGENETEKISSDLELHSTSEEIIEYSDESRKTESAVWIKAKSDSGKYYWVKQTDISTEPDSPSIELVSYYDWQKILRKITLSDTQKYIVCEPRKLQESDKSKAKFKEFDYESKKQAIVDCGIDESLAGSILKNDKAEYYFTHVNEWSNNDTQVTDLCKVVFDTKKIEDSLTAYEFFPAIKGQNSIPNSDIFCYAQPYYFLENLRRIATIKEFNPYELDSNKCKLIVIGDCKYYDKKNKKYLFQTKNKDGTWTKPTDFETNTDNYIRVSSPGGIEPLNSPEKMDNPGFAPFTENGCQKIYAPLTGVFNEDYLDVQTNNSNPPETYRNRPIKPRIQYHHIGVDFRASVGTKVESFIYGKVIVKGWVQTDGLSLIIQRNSPDSTGHNYLYLLCHLSEFGENIEEGSIILPGQVVAKTGKSGGDEGSYTYEKFSAHLHVSVIKYDKEVKKSDEILTEVAGGKQKEITTGKSLYKAYKNWNPINIVNKANLWNVPYIDPFNYKVNHIPTKEKK